MSTTTSQPAETSAANRDSHSDPRAGHGRMRYATPQELPSFPIVGVKENGSAASAAATLGWSRQKPFEHWKPDPSASASAAAVLAKDHKMAPLWEPERSSTGQKAAFLAVGNAQKHHQNDSISASTWGNSAANLAFAAAKASPKAAQDDLRPVARQPSLRAAKGAVEAQTRPRSNSSPTAVRETYPDQLNAATNARNAATTAHKPSSRMPLGGAVPYTTMDRQMYTSHPLVQPEVDERRRADILRASAVAMAKRMYDQQQKMIDTTKRAELGRRSSFERHGGSPSLQSEEPQTSNRFPNLHEAAYRLAQERLAKLTEEHQKNREYQDYYASTTGATSGARNKSGTLRGKLTRRRSSSDGDIVNDRQRSQAIRTQMSLFSNQLSKVDEEKRAKDRQAVLAAAQRNVKAKLDSIDQKIYAEHGRGASSNHSDWNSKAHAMAQARSDARMNDNNRGKIDLGAGMFIDQAQVNEIAARRVKPIIDDINERAEAERERKLALQLDEERKKEQAAKEVAREKEVQDIHKKLKDRERQEEKERKATLAEIAKQKKGEEKAAKAEQKAVAKEEKKHVKEEKAHEKDEENAVQAELRTIAKEEEVLLMQERLRDKEQEKLHAERKEQIAKEKTAHREEDGEHAKDETGETKNHSGIGSLNIIRKRRSQDDPRTINNETATTTLPVTNTEAGPTSTAREGRFRSFTASSAKQRRDSSPEPNEGSTSPTSKVRSWLKSRFSRPRSNSEGAKGKKKREPGAFTGGARLQRDTASSASSSSKSTTPAPNHPDDGSIREVALAKTTATRAPAIVVNDESGARTSLGQAEEEAVSSLSSSSNEDFVETEDHGLSAPRPIICWRDPATETSLGAGSERRSGSTTRGSGPRTSRFAEIID